MPLPPGYQVEQSQQQPAAAAGGNPPAGYQLETPDSGSPTFYAEGTAPKTFGGFMSNLFHSIGRLAEGVATGIAHPIRTAEGAVDLAAGGLNKLYGDTDRTNLALANGLDRVLSAKPGDRAAAYASALPQMRKAGLNADEAPDQYPGDDWLGHVAEAHADDQKFDAVASQLKQRYRSIDAAKQTMYEDPMGFLADLSTVLGGGKALFGSAAELADAANLTRTANAARLASELTGGASKVTNPLYVPSQGTAKVLDAVSDSVARRLYASALKPNGNLSLEATREAIATGLREGLNPTKESDLAELQRRLGDVRQQIDSGIQARAGQTIDPADVAKRVDAVIDRFKTVNPQADLKDIQRVRQNFLDQFQQAAPQPSGLLGPNGQPLAAPPAPPARKMTLPEAQDMKEKTGAKLSGEYGQQGTADVEAEKALNLGLKEEIEKIFPEVEGLNQKQGVYMNLEPMFERAVKNYLKRDIVPGTAGDTTAIVKKFFDDPKNKARIAIMLEKTPQFAPSTGMKVGQRLALIDSRVNDYLKSLSAPTQ